MDNQEVYSCIIPVYNEEKTGMEPLKKISKIKKINKVVCVDDGSTDNSAKIIQKNFPEFELIKLNKNKGKAEAIRRGLNKINTKYVLLLDADIKKLRKNELEKAIRKTKERKPEMIILKRIKAPFHIKFFRLNILLSGQRIIKTKNLKKILKEKECKRYQIEVVTNEYMIKNNKKVFWLPYSGENIPRKKKWGTHNSPYFKMYLRSLSYLGLFSALRQIFCFCRKRA